MVGNALVAVAYGILWSGVRNFEGKRLSVVQTVAGAIVWLAACLVDPIYAMPAARATVLAAIAIAYTLLSLLELWRGRDDGVWRWPVMLLLLVHTVVIPIRIELAGPAAYPDLRRVKALYRRGTRVIDDLTLLDHLSRAPWNARSLQGHLDAPFLDLTPGQFGDLCDL